MESLLVRVQPEPLDLMEIITASAGPSDEDDSDRHEYGTRSADPSALASSYNPEWVQHRSPDGLGLGHTIRRQCDAECAKFIDTTFHQKPPPLSWEMTPT